MGKSRVLSRQLHSIGVPPGAYGRLAENRKPGVNPGRYRHCKRGGRVQDESQSLGKFPEKACPDRRSASQETCSRCMECSLFSCVRTGVFVLLTGKRPEAVRFGLLPADFLYGPCPLSARSAADCPCAAGGFLLCAAAPGGQGRIPVFVPW